MLNTAGLFEENPIQGTVGGISAEIPDLFGRKFDRLNRTNQIAVGDTNVLFDTSYDLTQKPDLAAAATARAIDLLEPSADFGREQPANNLKFDNSSLTSQSDVSTQIQRDELTGMDFAVGDFGSERWRTQSQISSQLPSEKWEFNFKDYTIDHQGLNTLNIQVNYNLKPGITPNEYPDFVPIYKSIDNFLVNYPNETDVWENINKNLSQKVLDENPALTDITIQLEVLPTDRLPYDRTSTVFRSRSGQIEENGNFSLTNYAINHQGFNKLNLDVNYQYKPGIFQNEYPDFQLISQSIDNFLTKYPNETDFWEVVNKKLTQNILNENPSLASINVDFKVLPTQSLPYNRTSKVTRTQPTNPQGTFLVGNTRGNNVLRFDGNSGNFLGEFIPAGSVGLSNPDTVLFGPDGNGDGKSDIYIASGDKPGNSEEPTASAVLRYDGVTGEYIDRFVADNPNTATDETGGLSRPYGLAFGPDGNLYVSSFLTDKILRYSGKTGQFIDVFAAGNQQPGGLNGPNGLLFAPDGYLYVTTQGSVARNNQADFSANFPSQVLRYNPETRESSIFASPDPSPRSQGFVSLLGMAIDPVDGDLYVSDFANDIRRYNLNSGELVKVLSTNYTDTSPSSNYMGSLAFSPIGNLFAVGFDNRAGANGAGAVLRYSGKTDEPLPISSNTLLSNNSIFVSPDSKLQRPVGIAFFPSDAQLTEKWNFTLANYPIDHQGLNNLNLDVNYQYKKGIQNYQYPDFVPIYKSIDNFLVNYPNETDFWEIVNKNLTEKVLADNPGIASVTVDLDVLPTEKLPYDRSSTVTRTADGKLGEAWDFQIPGYAIEHQGLNNLNIDVKYQYKPGITQDEYPDFVPIYKSIDSFLTNYPNETDFWEILNKSLTQKVRAENPALDSLQINLEVLPSSQLPYNRASIVSIA
ncbi:NHL repeat-containing protein [Tychonema sp. LEGE 07203]|uniref:Vgb family protein n=1 Tax=Tychonema sp. LEGE 07203 TaxID=1828671 RepID=UPI00187DDDAF|nr:NHL repeat-containing protein [Tychonema sp. LEGE 07203]MBE9092581.1 NHL repeat-containing protein [Tychonema sp. LEGE 07203]